MCTTFYKCFFFLCMQQGIQEMLWFCVSIRCRQFVQNTDPWSYLTKKIQIDFNFYISVLLNFPQKLQCSIDKRLNYLENMYLEVVTQSSSMKKLFLKILQKLENTCDSVSFLIIVAAWTRAALLKRDPSTGVALWILRNFQEQLYQLTFTST